MTVGAASEAGLVGAKRVLDSTPLYDAVATMDTVTLMRSAMRGVFKVADSALEAQLRQVITSGDDYASSAKPQIDWDDQTAREELIDSRAKDGYAILAYLDGCQLEEPLAEAVELLATVLGQDLETTDDGVFRIARRVAKDRVISTVDSEARHGHKTSARGFDGYKGSVAIDPDSEIITDTTVSAGNAGDVSVAADLIDDLIDDTDTDTVTVTDTGPGIGTVEEGTPASKSRRGGGRRSGRAKNAKNKQAAQARRAEAKTAARKAKLNRRRARQAHADGGGDRPRVYGDAAYGSGQFLDRLARAGIESRCKCQPPAAAGGLFPKDRFHIDLDRETVTCPADVTVTIRRGRDGDGMAYFADACEPCPLRAQCTNAHGGRTIAVGRYEKPPLRRPP